MRSPDERSVTVQGDQPSLPPVVVVNTPPCERSFSLQFKADGELRGVEIDGVYYATVRRKRTMLCRPGDWLVTLFETVKQD